MESFRIVLFVIIMLTLMLFGLVFPFFSAKFTKSEKHTIIEKYNSYNKEFNNVVDELKIINDTSQNIYIHNNYIYIYINIYDYNNDKLNIIKVNRREFHFYQNSIDLMKKLHLTSIVKENTNIIFNFNFGQAIAIINDEDKLYEDFHILEKIHLKDNWYYMQIKT